MLLRGHDAKPDWLTYWLDRTIGYLTRPFNALFERASLRYVGGVRRALRFTGVAVVLATRK